MHTTEVSYVDSEEPDDVRRSRVWYLHHNGDYSGDVVIGCRAYNVRVYEENYDVSVPFEVLAELVGQAVLSQKVSELEQLSGLEQLGFSKESNV